MTNRNQNIGSIVKVRLIPAYDVTVPNFSTVNLSQLDIPPGKSFETMSVADNTGQYNSKARETPSGTLYDITLSFSTQGVLEVNRRNYPSKVVAWLTDAHGVHVILPPAKIFFSEGIGKTPKSENSIDATLSVTSEIRSKFLIDDGYTTPPVEVDDFLIYQDAGILTFETFESDFTIFIRLFSGWAVKGSFYINLPDGTIGALVIPDTFTEGVEYEFNLTNVPQGYVFKIWPSEMLDSISGEIDAFWTRLPYTFIQKLEIKSAGIKRFDMQWSKRNYIKWNFAKLDLSNNALDVETVNRIIKEYALNMLSWGGSMQGWVHDIYVNGGTSSAPVGQSVSLGQQLLRTYPEINLHHNGEQWHQPIEE